MISVVGLCVLGCGICFCIITSVSEVVENAQNVFINYSKEETSDIISGITTSVYFIAEFYAPPLSGFLSENIGFSNAQACFSGLYFIIFLYLIFEKKPGVLSEEKGLTKKKNSDNGTF